MIRPPSGRMGLYGLAAIAALGSLGGGLRAASPKKEVYGPPNKPEPETWKQRERRLRRQADRITKRS